MTTTMKRKYCSRAIKPLVEQHIDAVRKRFRKARVNAAWFRGGVAVLPRDAMDGDMCLWFVNVGNGATGLHADPDEAWAEAAAMVQPTTDEAVEHVR